MLATYLVVLVLRLYPWLSNCPIFTFALISRRRRRWKKNTTNPKRNKRRWKHRQNAYITIALSVHMLISRHSAFGVSSFIHNLSQLSMSRKMLVAEPTGAVACWKIRFFDFVFVDWMRRAQKNTNGRNGKPLFFTVISQVFFFSVLSLLFLLRLLILVKPNIYYDYCYDFIICLLFKFNAKTIMIRIKASTSATAFHFSLRHVHAHFANSNHERIFHTKWNPFLVAPTDEKNIWKENGEDENKENKHSQTEAISQPMES